MVSSKGPTKRYYDTAARTAGHFAHITPGSDFFHHTFCTVHLAVNPLLTTIVHHIFSSVLAEPQYIY